jgi:hypothetical protein
MPRRPALPKDPSQRAKTILETVLGERATKTEPELTEAQKFARSGGLKGGDARAKGLSSARRKEIAKIAADKRWAKVRGRKGKDD